MTLNQNFTTALEASMRAAKMQTYRAVKLSDQAAAVLVGTRTHTATLYGTNNSNLVLACDYIALFDCLQRKVTPQDAVSFFEAAFQRARKVHGIPLPRGLVSYVIVSLLLVKSRDPALIDYATIPTPKRFALYNFPIVIEQDTGELHFSRTDVYQGQFCTYTLQLAESCIFPATYG